MKEDKMKKIIIWLAIGIIIGLIAGLLIGGIGGYVLAHKSVRGDFGKLGNMKNYCKEEGKNNEPCIQFQNMSRRGMPK